MKYVVLIGILTCLTFAMDVDPNRPPESDTASGYEQENKECWKVCWQAEIDGVRWTSEMKGTKAECNSGGNPSCTLMVCDAC